MQKLLITIMMFCLLGCGGNKGVPNGNSTACSTMGTVKDFTGLDGCKLLIVLENGDKLEPAVIKDGITLRDGQSIKFGYKEMKDMMSICMAGTIVEITCAEILSEGNSNTRPTKGGKPAKIHCIETLDPYETEWMKKTLQMVQAYQVIRYKYLADGWAYYFKGQQKSVLKDCQGTILCEASTKDEPKCNAKAEQLSEEIIIWEIE